MRSQTERLHEYLRTHPNSSSLDIVRDLSILNTTGRISDLRAQGIEVDSYRDKWGVWRYRIVEQPTQFAAGF